jgi:hypothetical protein
MNRRERRAHTRRDNILRASNGWKMAVTRPDDPAKAIAIAQEALDKQDQALLDDLPNRTGCKYTFVGWLSRKQCIVNSAGVPIDALRPGDSFVTFPNDQPPIMALEEQPS